MVVLNSLVKFEVDTNSICTKELNQNLKIRLEMKFKDCLTDNCTQPGIINCVKAEQTTQVETVEKQ